MVPERWYLVQVLARVVESGTKKIGVPVRSLYESVPITISSVDVSEFSEQILALKVQTVTQMQL